MDQEQLQKHLDSIKSGLLHVSGYLSMLSKLGAIHPGWSSEAERHLNELGEMMKAVQTLEQELL